METERAGVVLIIRGLQRQVEHVTLESAVDYCRLLVELPKNVLFN